MPGNTYKGSRNIKGKSTRKSQKSFRRTSRISSNNKEETFVEAILSDMPKPSSNLTKMDHMGNRTQTGLINPQNLNMTHFIFNIWFNKIMICPILINMYSADQIMGNQIGHHKWLHKWPPMAPQMMPPMGTTNDATNGTTNDVWFKRRYGTRLKSRSYAHPGCSRYGRWYGMQRWTRQEHPEGAHPEGAHEGQTGMQI